MLVLLAQAGATFPTELPAEGETGSSYDRATADRLANQYGSLTTTRQAAAARGADLMRNAGLATTTTPPVLLSGLGDLANSYGSPNGDLLAAVALACSTVYSRFDAAQNSPADMWLQALQQVRQAGASPEAVTRRVAA